MRSFAIKMFLAVMAVAGFSIMAAAQVKTVNFDLHVIPAEVSCLSADGGPDANRPRHGAAWSSE